jgi:hypothetical protein
LLFLPFQTFPARLLLQEIHNHIARLMTTQENISHTLEKVLLLLYSIDVKLNDAFKCTTVSFTKSSSLFKSIFKPLQTHQGNLMKVITLPGATAINAESIKNSFTAITAKIQFHDVIEQRLKHIRQIHNEMIQDLVMLRKSADKKPSDIAYIQAIAEINATQADTINKEYLGNCNQLDESLALILKYLSEWHQFSMTSSTAISNDENVLLFIENNSELGQRIVTIINKFKEDVSYRNTFSKDILEMNKALTSIASHINVKEKTPAHHSKIKRLEELYTTQGERDVFNKLMHDAKHDKHNLRSKQDSDVDLF